VERRRASRWRWNLKTALATTISRAHDHGLADALARGHERPLVIGYHRVVDDFAAEAKTAMPSMLTSARMFERHLDCIARNFQFVSVDDIGERLASGRPFGRPVAAITFDDGYYDNYEFAFPILKRKGIPAAVFVVTDLIGTNEWQVHDKLYHLVSKAFSTWSDPRREMTSLLKALGLDADMITNTRGATQHPQAAVSALLPTLPLADVRRVMAGLEACVGNGFHDIPRTLAWSDLKTMHRHGITIGSHTRSHVSLTTETPEIVAEELAGSKREIESQLGAPVNHFAYPGGHFDCRIVRAVADAGYKYAYTACQHGDQRHPTLTVERLLLWEGSSVDADGHFSPEILSCQAHDLWPPARKCGRIHRTPEAA
jgi:peptidoglycan/xylan/chitin deacetylase (PgdA/CDA1 family)